MAVGTYKLPICDGCGLPWLPVGWTQDADPRNLPEGSKPLRCGKCKSAGWDKLHNAEVRKEASDPSAVRTEVVGPLIYTPANVGIPDEELSDDEFRTRYAITASVERVKRCRHRMTNCPICTAEAA